MKTRFISLTALLAGAPSALAWPFTDGDGAKGGISSSITSIAFQADADGILETFHGGTRYIQREQSFNGITHTSVVLPLPDTDPYPASNPSVGFESNAGGDGDAGDVDGDGDTDLVYSTVVAYNNQAENQNTRVVVCLNDGSGNFTRGWQLKTTNATTYGTPDVKLADFDRDGDLDMADTSSGVRVRWNNGSGVFSTDSGVLVGAYANTPELEVADFDGNGWADIAVLGEASGTTGRITLLSNNGGTFTGSTPHTQPANISLEDSVTGDVDNDGRTDLVFSRRTLDGTMELHWLENSGGGTFAAPVLLHTTGEDFPSFTAGDLDEDGLTDIVFTLRGGAAQWLRGLGAGVFANAATLREDNTNPITNHLAMTLADIDRDGDADIMTASILLLNREPHKGADARVETWAGVNPGGAVKLAAGDVNNDGRDDLILSDGSAPRIRWYPGTGSGLGSPSFLSTGSVNPACVAAGDFNRDGWTDLAWTTTNTLTQALSTNGSGFSWNITTAATMSGITRILAADMDADGDTDILSMAPSASTIRIHANNGLATAWSPQNVDTGLPGLADFAAGQLIPGGRPEIASVLTGGFVERHHHSTASGWQDTPLANASGAAASRAVVITDFDPTLPGLETIYSLNNLEIRLDHDSIGLPLLVGNVPFATVRLAAVDWNADGLTDLLSATTDGVYLHLHSPSAQTFLTGIPLAAGVAFQDVVVMNLDGDSLPDAVAVQTTGQLRLIYNQSGAVRALVTGGTIRSAFPGYSAAVATVSGTAPAHRSGDAHIAPGSVRMTFRRSTLSGGVETPGTTLSAAEVSALVESVSLTRSSTPVVSSAPSSAFGEYSLLIPPAERAAIALFSPHSRLDLTLGIKLKTTAASASVQKFWVEYHADSPWFSLDANGDTISTPLRLTGTPVTQRTLFIVTTPSPLQLWRLSQFGTGESTGQAANDADPDDDGVPNLVEYVMNRDPNSGSGSFGGNAAPLDLTFTNRQTPVVVNLRTLTNYDSKIRLTIQYSTNLQSWTTLTTRTGTGAWSIAPDSTTPLSGGGRTWFKFSATSLPQFTFKQYFRLKAEELP